MPEGSSSLSARPALAYAKTGMITANTSMASSVLRRLGGPAVLIVVVLVVLLLMGGRPLTASLLGAAALRDQLLLLLRQGGTRLRSGRGRRHVLRRRCGLGSAQPSRRALTLLRRGAAAACLASGSAARLPPASGA